MISNFLEIVQTDFEVLKKHLFAEKNVPMNENRRVNIAAGRIMSSFVMLLGAYHTCRSVVGIANASSGLIKLASSILIYVFGHDVFQYLTNQNIEISKEGLSNLAGHFWTGFSGIFTATSEAEFKGEIVYKNTILKGLVA